MISQLAGSLLLAARGWFVTQVLDFFSVKPIDQSCSVGRSLTMTIIVMRVPGFNVPEYAFYHREKESLAEAQLSF